MSEVYLLGHPVSHSLSPAVHNAAFKALGLPHRYSLKDTKPEGLAGAIAALRSDPSLGANVTVPHKERAMRLVDELGEEARAIGAVNTIVRRGSRLVGHNTDAYGVSQAMAEVAAPKDVLLLGAGGAARACLHSLLLAGHRVAVANRTRARADDLVASIDGPGERARVTGWPMKGAPVAADVVVNATSLGLHGEDPLEDIPLPAVVVDIVAIKGGTPLVRRAREAQDVVVVEGSMVLLHQAVRAFELWTGVGAPLEVMRAALLRAA